MSMAIIRRKFSRSIGSSPMTTGRALRVQGVKMTGQGEGRSNAETPACRHHE
jgi:hypothetical protein